MHHIPHSPRRRSPHEQPQTRGRLTTHVSKSRAGRAVRRAAAMAAPAARGDRVKRMASPAAGGGEDVAPEVLLNTFAKLTRALAKDVKTFGTPGDSQAFRQR